MATATRNTASKQRKNSVRNSTRSDEFAISNIEISIENIKCSVCNRIPDKEIFNCLKGHLNCDICKQVYRTCSWVEYKQEDGDLSWELCEQVLTRSAVSESLLNKITFKCPWRNLGCEEASIRRSQLTAHKKSCENNPNILNCSQLCHFKCDYQFGTVSVDDDDGIKEMKEHPKSHDKELSTSDTIFEFHKKQDNFLYGNLKIKFT